MTDRVLPPAIPGAPLQPPARGESPLVRRIDERSAVAALVLRAWFRFSLARATLLAAGTAYFVFLSLFALIALGFGLAAWLGADLIAEALTEALENTFPGLLGRDEIDPEAVRSFGTLGSLVAVPVLLYSGSAAVNAASAALHLIYGAPKDPRPYVVVRLRAVGWLLVLAPLILVAFAPSVVVSAFGDPVVALLRLPERLGHWLLTGVSVMTALAGSLLVLWVVLGELGGIRPPTRPRLAGAALGAGLIQLLILVMSLIVGWAMDRPQFGAFAAPIAVLLVLYLLCLVTFASAALTGALAAHDDTGGAVADG